MRLQLAAESRARRKAEAADLKAKNMEYYRVLHQTKPAYLAHAGAATGLYSKFNDTAERVTNDVAMKRAMVSMGLVGFDPHSRALSNQMADDDSSGPQRAYSQPLW